MRDPVVSGPCCYTKGFCVQDTQGPFRGGLANRCRTTDAVARVQVKNDGQIRPALTGSDLADIFGLLPTGECLHSPTGRFDWGHAHRIMPKLFCGLLWHSKSLSLQTPLERDLEPNRGRTAFTGLPAVRALEAAPLHYQQPHSTCDPTRTADCCR